MIFQTRFIWQRIPTQNYYSVQYGDAMFVLLSSLVKMVLSSRQDGLSSRQLALAG